MDSEVTSGSQKGKTTGTSSSKTTRRSWTREEEDVMIHGLKDIVTEGWKVDNNTFQSGYLQVLEQKFIIALPGTDLRATPHIESNIKWKKSYGSLFSILGKSGIGWNDSEKMLEIIDKELWDDLCNSEGGVGVEMDFSMSATNPSFSNSTYLERSSGQLEFIGYRMGYHHDLSNARRSINAELLKLPIGPDDRLAALDIIADI
ncbi:hypothetical protein Acr_22g0009290 [Actinidia rufa]|uniref:Myb/SANT-like domain-containing protein n=1 Tax=Actinidia rufa TaxID=165716 RepID=A0A7J0GLB2_9ERIC|nr:hypothetical protein Acr_22g0009290 [Actinidia rufa]